MHIRSHLGSSVNSGADVEWLMDTFSLDLSLVARLGGHSQLRTHRHQAFTGGSINGIMHFWDPPKHEKLEKALKKGLKSIDQQ